MNKYRMHLIFGLAISISISLPTLSGLITNTLPTIMINMKSIGTQDAFALDAQGVELNIKNIIVNKTSDSTATIKVIFLALNPQTNTILLDGIHYNVYFKNLTLSSGDIGSEAVIDVMRSEPEFPIISNDTVILKNVQTIHTNEIKNDILNTITAGKACFAVNGTYFYRQTANLAASGGGNEFQITFPNNCK